MYGDLSWFLATAGGTHQLKLGGEWERSSMIDEIWAIGGYEYVDDGTVPFLLYYEPNPGASPSKGQQLSGFVQDEWRIRERLTLKGGLRYDAVRFDNDVGTTVIDYGKLQPRLGLAWDLSSKATSVARASWGRYMHPGILVVPWLARQQQLPTFISLSCSYFGFSRADCQANFGGELTAGGLTVPT